MKFYPRSVATGVEMTDVGANLSKQLINFVLGYCGQEKSEERDDAELTVLFFLIPLQGHSFIQRLGRFTARTDSA